MDSVMKGLTGAMAFGIFGLEPLLVKCNVLPPAKTLNKVEISRQTVTANSELRDAGKRSIMTTLFHAEKICQWLLKIAPMYTPMKMKTRIMLPMPMASAKWARLRASRDLTSAVTLSPAAIAARHSDARMMAKMPMSQQQQTVTKIE